MRILFCTHVYPPDGGGVASFAHDLVTLLRNSGNDVRLLHELGDGEDTCGSVAVWMHRYRRSRVGMALRFLHFLCAAAAFRPEVVICSTWLYYGLPATRFSWLFGYKVVIQVHGTEVRGRFRQGRRRKLMTRVLKSAHQLWPNSHFTADLLSELGCTRVQMQTIHPFLSADLIETARRIRGTPRTVPPLLLTAGHLYPRKGIDLVLRALSHLQDLEWQFAIAGEEARPGYRQRYETMAEELGIASRVRFLGRIPRPELWEMMARVSIFVMTSRPDPDDIESFGIVYIEAQAFGVACVAARVGGVPEAVGDGGVLIPPEDPMELVPVLRELLVHPERTRRFARQGRERVFASFTEEARRAEIMSCLESLRAE
ncbi:MAG: glycosyltransferase family 4 protein [Chloroflexi bacterium]|nr:glycosyltransferase family 4 protein [Chloroflexota bacterium]